MVIEEFRSRKGGLIRIMDDYLPKTEQERQERMRNVERVCCEVLAHAVAMHGEDWTLDRMTNGPHADMIPDRRTTA